MRLVARGTVPGRACRLACTLVLSLCAGAAALLAQQQTPSVPSAPLSASPPISAAPPPLQPAIQPPATTVTSSISGTITDTNAAAVPGARVALKETDSNGTWTAISDGDGAFVFSSLQPGRYIVTVHAAGFSPWKIHDVLVIQQDEALVLPEIQLGVASVNTTVNAISVEVLAERQITVEEHQRILGILPNFYVSYLPNAAPLTPRQKFKLAVHVSVDPITFFKVSVAAGIEQWQGDFAGYGPGFSGYAQRYGASYGDSLSSTFLGAALFPSLFHQDPRYFYRGHGRIITRALYAISTVVVCKGDSGHWQPNFSNVLGNLGSAGISTLYYPSTDRHSVQVTVDNTLIGVAEGAFGTLFQEFLLRHFTHGKPPAQP